MADLIERLEDRTDLADEEDTRLASLLREAADALKRADELAWACRAMDGSPRAIANPEIQAAKHAYLATRKGDTECG